MAALAITSWADRSPLVSDIAPVDGWTLHECDEDDSDGFTTTRYFASKDGQDRFFSHCRFGFCPTQERFDFLVRNDFPHLGGKGPTTNRHIDDAIRAERAAAGARHGLSEAQATAIAWVLSA